MGRTYKDKRSNGYGDGKSKNPKKAMKMGYEVKKAKQKVFTPKNVNMDFEEFEIMED